MLRRVGTLHINRWVPPLAVASLAVVVYITAGINDAMSLALASLNALVALSGVLQSASHGLRPVAAAFYIFWFAWLGIGPIAQLTLGREAWGDTSILVRNERLYAALWLTVLAVVFFWVGERFGRSRATAPVQLGEPAVVRPIAVPLLIVLLAVVGPIAVRVVGFSNYFSSRSARSNALSDSGNSFAEIGGPLHALYVIFPMTLSVAILLLSVYQMRESWHGVAGIRPSHLVGLIVGLAGVGVFANPLSQSRFVALTAFGSLLIALLRPRSSKAGALFVALGLILSVLVYPLANALRYTNSTLRDITAVTYTSPDFDGFQQIVNTVTYVERHGYTWGNEVLSAVLFFVPRSLWEGKAASAGAAIARDAGYAFTNLSLPVHAELYLQFGLAGVGLGMIALGYFASRLDDAWLSDPRSKSAMIAPYMAVAMFGVLRGPLSAQVPVYLPVLIILAVSIRSGRRRGLGPTG